MKNPTWTLLIPTLNEGESLGSLLDSLFAQPSSRSAEVLILDGGSSDRTHDAYLHARASHPSLSWVGCPPGKGMALRIGFHKARGRYIAFLDADGQYPPSELPRLMRRVERGADLVVTRRRVRGEHSPLRRALSLGYSQLVARGLARLPVHDPQSGMKALRASLLPRLRLTARDWALDGEIIQQAVAAGARIEEVEIDFHPRVGGATKTGVLGTSWDLLKGGVRLALAPSPPAGAPPAPPPPSMISAAPSRPRRARPARKAPRPSTPRRKR